jgi:hypothetical protein
MDAIDRYLERLDEPGLRDRLRAMYYVDEDEVSRDVATQEQIVAVERELGIRLPPSYKKLVTALSPYDGGFEAYGIIGRHEFGADIVSANPKSGGQTYPPFLIGVVLAPTAMRFASIRATPTNVASIPSFSSTTRSTAWKAKIGPSSRRSPTT